MMNEYDRRALMLAAMRTGREGVIRLFAQLCGWEPCPKCDYIKNVNGKSGCRCPKMEESVS